jgi:hypothetical protein
LRDLKREIYANQRKKIMGNLKEILKKVDELIM